MITRFFNAKILRDHEFREEDLWIDDGLIIPPAKKAERDINAKNMLIAPGYIDLQVNGAFGYDFNSSEGSLDPVAKGLPKYGVTSFLPTLITSNRSVYLKRLPQLQPRTGGKSGANCLGIHIEGPFLNPKQKGAHRDDLMEIPRDWSLEDFYGSLEGIKLLTLAPEMPGALKMIKELTRKGIVASLGHTEASYHDAILAVEAGAKIVTHLFNAQSSLHHRSPGIVGAALTLPDLYFSIIADGIHVHESVLNIAYKCKPNKLVLITDAISALGLPAGVYHLGLDLIEVDHKKAYLPHSKQLAGAIGTMDFGVRHLKESTGCTDAQAIECATLHPAEVLGIQNQKGTLKEGADADFILLDQNLFVKSAYVNGVLQF